MANAQPVQASSAARPQTVSPPAGPLRAKQRKRLLSPGRIFFVIVTVLLCLGWYLPTEPYITPKRGLGYALGIAGGSLMLLLFLYSVRKRIRWLWIPGPTAAWFRFHMVLGILGPMCILYHSNFALGAPNSNVALFCMLTVAGSGLTGRYIYARIHHGLYGSKLTLRELQAGADRVRALPDTISFLPELVSRLETLEKRVLGAGPHLPVLGFVKPAVVAVIALKARWQLHSYVRTALRLAARRYETLEWERKHMRRTACTYIDTRLAATRRVADFQGYERLFSLWHALHLPLIFLLIVAAVVHVVAVHVY
jgi:hypothetical protein